MLYFRSGRDILFKHLFSHIFSIRTYNVYSDTFLQKSKLKVADLSLETAFIFYVNEAMSRSEIFGLHETSKCRFYNCGEKVIKPNIFSGKLMLS